LALGLRNRLALFLVVTLVAVQLATAATVYGVARRVLIREGQDALEQSAELLDRQLEVLARRLAEGGKILSLDYALRQSIAQREHATVLSALRNFGRRIGADRMLLLDLDGGIAVDTGRPGAEMGGGRFAYPDLMDQATVEGRAAALAVLDGRVWRMVVVPVLAPQPLAFIAILVPVDKGFAGDLRSLSSLSKSIAVVAETSPGAWSVVTSTDTVRDPLRDLPAPGGMARLAPEVRVLGGEEMLVMASPLRTAQGSPAVAVVLQYPLAAALEPYRPIVFWLSVLLVGGLLAALVGTVMIARGVTRPLEALARVARRIEAGDYSPPPPLPERDEIGQLSTALGSMAHAIADREEHIRHQATHDADTGLANRTRLEEVGGMLLADPGRRAALLLVGIERLREINNTLGHEVGARLVADAGARLAGLLGPGALVARVADTDLAVLLPDMDPAAVPDAAARIAATFEAPYAEGDLSVDLAVAVGAALAPDHGLTVTALLQHADVALFAARRADPPIRLYDAAADPRRPERLSLMGELKEAIEQDTLALHYQPKLDLATGRLSGAEALVRWIHPKRGFIPPDSFIPLAEETGTIRRLSRWGLGTAARQLRAWTDQGLALRLAVNLSVRDLADATLPDHIAGLLAEHGLTPDRLVLEITESAIMGEPDAAISVLKRLADRGLDLAIDDFGVGQSSFAYLRRLPVRELKIDKSFVLTLASQPQDQAIVRSIVEVGHSLGYSTTAEGVEDAAALELLRAMGCDSAQGYHIARPMAAAPLAEFLAASPWAPVRLETGVA